MCQGRIPSLFRWECRHLATANWRAGANPYNFCLRCISLISPFGNYGTFDDLLALIRLTLSLTVDPLVGCEFQAVRALLTPGWLPTTDAGEVDDLFT